MTVNSFKSYLFIFLLPYCVALILVEHLHIPVFKLDPH